MHSLVRMLMKRSTWCDTINPRYLIDAGQVNVQIGICPVKPAEFVIFSIGQWDGGALIEKHRASVNH